MHQNELEMYRRTLLATGARLRGNVAGVGGEVLRQAGGEASGGLSNTPLHPADLGTDTFIQEVSLSLLETQEQIYEQVADALQRVEDGTFGVCQECGREIAPERLQALPYTPHCITCAQRVQREEAQAVGSGY